MVLVKIVSIKLRVIYIYKYDYIICKKKLNKKETCSIYLRLWRTFMALRRILLATAGIILLHSFQIIKLKTLSRQNVKNY